MKNLRDQCTAFCSALSGRKRFALYILSYTAVFLVLYPIIFSAFLQSGTSFVWRADGVSQHFVRLLYLNDRIRDGISSLLSGKGWTVPLYDFQTALTSVDLQAGFPYLLAALFPADRIDVFYNVLVSCLYYLAGLTFSCLAFTFRRDMIAVLSGAVSYAFSGFALFAAVRHTHFMVPAVFLPLLIIGAEKVIRKKPGWLLTVMVFLSATTQWGLYFSCMQAALVVLYVTVRFFDICHKDRIKEYFLLWGRLCVWGGTGVLLAGAVLLPAFFSIVGTGRVGRDISAFQSLFRYSILYYKMFFAYFFVLPRSPGDWTYLGFTVLAMPSIVWLFSGRGKDMRTLRVLFILLTLMLWIPAFGYILSGFSNVSNRFCYAYALCVSAVITFLFPGREELRLRDALLPCACLAVYMAVPFLVQVPIPGLRVIVCLFAVLCAVLLFTALRKKQAGLIVRLTLLVIVCVSVCISAASLYGPDNSNYASEYVASPYPIYQRSQYESLHQSDTVNEDTGFFRVAASSLTRDSLNMSFFYDLNGITMYPYFGWSDVYLDWLREMEVPLFSNKQLVFGVGTNARLLSLLGVKYYALREDSGLVRPSGFTEIDTIENQGSVDLILQNENSLPLGYTYNAYILRDSYESLSPLDRQEQMMRTVVLDTSPQSPTLRSGSAVHSARKVPAAVEKTDGLTWENGLVRVEKPEAVIVLSFEPQKDTELWLRVVDLDLTDGSSTRQWTLWAETDSTRAKGDFAADGYVYSSLQHTQMLPLGYSSDGFSRVTVTFPETGTFLLEDLEVWCQPPETIAAEVSTLRAEPLEDLRTGRRGLHGKINVSEDKILCLSIPWLDGWTAYLDGTRVPLLHANTGFMAVEVPEGEHEVELLYMLPGLRGGLCLSAIGVICLLLILRKERKTEHLAESEVRT